MPLGPAIQRQSDPRQRAGTTRLRTAPTLETTLIVCAALALALAAIAFRLVARL
jgi:hypothetical protein